VEDAASAKGYRDLIAEEVRAHFLRFLFLLFIFLFFFFFLPLFSAFLFVSCSFSLFFLSFELNWLCSDTAEEEDSGVQAKRVDVDAGRRETKEEGREAELHFQRRQSTAPHWQEKRGYSFFLPLVLLPFLLAFVFFFRCVFLCFFFFFSFFFFSFIFFLTFLRTSAHYFARAMLFSRAGHGDFE
jgi:hypothetical protein